MSWYGLVSFCAVYFLAVATPGPGVAAVIATHNLESIRHMDRVLSLKDGRLVEHRAVARLPSESLEDWEIRLVARRLALSGDGE